MGGTYHTDDKVWYYEVDKSKIKRGVKVGRWIRAKVVRASPRSSMVVIDLGTRILQVNQSLPRRDAHKFSRVEVPTVSGPFDPATPDVPPPLASASSSSTSHLATEPVLDGASTYAHALWQCMMKGKFKIGFPRAFCWIR